MKTTLTILAVIITGWASGALAQTLPGAPEANGLNPKSSTIYINRQTADIPNINNGKAESVGVAIASGGNVIVGWEDDGSDLADLEAAWTMFDSGGVSITPPTRQSSLQITGTTLTNTFLSYFRADGSALPGATSWGPKIHANLFGEGVGMGATSFALGEEVAAFAAYDDSTQGDFPTVQLLNNSGQPAGIVAGVTSEYATRDSGSIRIADWEYLSNGNILVVDESRQDQELVDVYKGTDAGHHAIFRIVDPKGTVVKSETLASETPVKSEIWHGAAVTQNGFAVRFSGPGGATVRLFDNAGNPTSTNLDLATLTGHPEAGGGGRGDSVGFHGNGKDAYLHVNDAGTTAWITVLNTNGTVRFSKSAADDVSIGIASVGRTDGAIDADGNVIAVFGAKLSAAGNQVVLGRRFDASGKALGGTFYISENETPDNPSSSGDVPRVAWRNGEVAIAWVSKDDAETLDPTTGTPKPVVALRLFSTFNPGGLESVGLTRIVPDTPIIKPAADSLGNWEPYASVLGNSVFLIEGNTFADDAVNQRFVVALQPVDGKPGKTVEGFYSDDGKAFTGQINASRQNGNPGRVAGDTRPGAVNYMVGAEASPHTVSPQFTSDNRWTLGFDRLSDGRYGTVETYKLDSASLTPTPLMKAADSANGREKTGTPAGNQITRFGGNIAGLDNGNFVSVVEDRGHTRSDADCVTATIFAPDGSIVKESWVVVNSDIWANVAPFKGGFAIRAKPADGSSTRLIYFYDNAGNLKGTVDQATSGVSFDTGRGDGTRIFGHINSPYVYLTGKAANTTIVKVTSFDSRTQKFVAVADVSEGGFSGGFDRAAGAVDALNRLVVSWVVGAHDAFTKEQVAARVLAFDGTANKFTPLTASFFPFINHATNDIHTLGMTVAMTTKQICIGAKGEINYSNKPELGPDSPKEVNFYTVFTHPAPKDDPTTPAGGGVGTVTISTTGFVAGKLNISWSGGTGPFTVQKKNSLTDPGWTDVTTVTTSSASLDVTGAMGFFRVKGQ